VSGTTLIPIIRSRLPHNPRAGAKPGA
jgi:hypothetical protein